MISPEVVEIVSIVANQVTFPLSVPKRRSQGEVVVEEHATSVEMKVINLEIVLPNRPVGVGIAIIVVSPDICLPTVPRRGNPGAVVEVDHVMDVERKGISLETVLRRLVEEVAEDALIVGKMVIS